MKRTIALVIIGLFCTSRLIAQGLPMPVYDKAKHYQLRSMETGPWRFWPEGWYYSWWHKDMHFLWWNWSVKLPGLGIHDRGPAGIGGGDNYVRNYAPNYKLRASMLLTAQLSKKQYKAITEKISNVHKRELVNIADRKTDIVYTDYKKLFQKLDALMVKNIIVYRREIGNDDTLLEFITEHKKIKHSIEMIHNSYVTNIDRQKVYMEQLKKLEELISKCLSCLQTNHMFNALDKYKQDGIL